MALAQVLSIRTEPAPSPQTICDYKYCNCIFDGDEALHFHNISTNHDLIDLINDPNVRFALRVPEAEGRPTTIDEISSDPTLLNEDSQAGYKWSTTTPENYEFVLKALVDHCHAVDTLLENEYRITPHTTEEINDIQRCINCKRKRRTLDLTSPCSYHSQKRKVKNGSDKGQIYLCCGKNDQVGCSTLPTHHFAPINADIILQFSTSTTAPSPDPLRPKRAAIALDCEMVAVHGEWRQVAHLAAVDYITGETLIDTLIQPTVEVVDWGSEITGISEASMSEAIQRSRALPGWSAARQTLWEFMDSDTVLVGQSLQFDLEVLAMLHTRIVDSEILTTSAVRLEGGRKRGLKELCKSILRLDIQGREHSAREDALAARELVLVLCGQEKRFKAWADKVRQTEGARLEERRKRREIQERECAVKGA